MNVMLSLQAASAVAIPAFNSNTKVAELTTCACLCRFAQTFLCQSTIFQSSTLQALDENFKVITRVLDKQHLSGQQPNIVPLVSRPESSLVGIALSAKCNHCCFWASKSHYAVL
jgi:hypothetical protein